MKNITEANHKSKSQKQISKQILKQTQSKSQSKSQSKLKAYSKQKMSSTTFAMRVKEIMNNMPDSLDTKKEIDEYYKNAMKDIKEKNKEEKKEKKANKALPKKRTKKVDVDDDGNEIVKVKRPLNNYQKFIQDNRAKVKEENPTLNGEEIFTLIAELWNKHKKSMKKDDDKKDSDDGYHTGDDTIRPDDGNETDDSEDDNKKDSDDDKKDSDDDKKEDKKVPKGGKAPRKALGVKAAPKKKKESS